MTFQDLPGVAAPRDVCERTPILGGQGGEGAATETRVYIRRYYILFVFSLASFNTAMIWNTWGPITESVEAVFGWHDSDIGMLANYGFIFFTASVLLMAYLMDVKGLRWAVVSGTFLIMAGTVSRCFSMQHTVATWTAGVCAALNGVGGTVPMAGVALVSSAWFPPQQRATATGAMTFSNSFGLAMSFIIAPQLVRSPSNTTDGGHNHTNVSDYSLQMSDDETFGKNPQNITNIPELTSDIRHLLYLYGGLCTLAFVLAVAYFPSRPPLPPSLSAAHKRVDYLRGLGQLLCNGSVWLSVLAYAIPTGVISVWSGVLDVNLNPLGINQKTVGYLGFWQTIAGCTAQILVSRFSDVFMRRMKLTLICLMSGGVVSAVWFLMLCEKYIPFNMPSLYISIIVLGMCVLGAVPLFYEMTCEVSYPVAEGVTGGLLTLANNIVGVTFLFMLLIKHIGTAWMNWVLLGSIIASLPLLVFFPERYRRTDVDTVHTDVNNPGTDHTPSIQDIY